MQVICKHNEGYTWANSQGVYFKGYIQKEDDRIPLRGINAITFFLQASSFKEFVALLEKIDGVFSVIVRNGEKTWAAVDIARSMPVYYARDASIVSDSAEEIRKRMGITKEDADPYALEELLISTFIGHTRTAYAQIGQLDAGQAAEFNRNIVSTKRYYFHYQKTIQIERTEAIQRLQKTADDVFADTIAAIEGRPIVLSLSGGYDSRYVACMLKRFGIQDVSCYTYGRADSFEVKQSHAVAHALGYRWAFVEHTDDRMSALLAGENLSYCDMNDGHDFTVFLQNYAAVKYLHESGWIKQGSVFLTGLCQDMPTGYYAVMPDEIPNYTLSVSFLAEYIADRRHFFRMQPEARKAYLSEVERHIAELGLAIDSDQAFASAFDAVWTSLEHSRNFLHMNDAHAYFGYEWLLPCWNKRSLDFWYSMPQEYRLKQNLYEEWIMTGLPAQYGIGDKKQVVSYTLTRGWSRFKARCRLVLNRLIFIPLGVPLRQKTDFNNDAAVIKEAYRHIHQKRMIGFRNSGIIFVLGLYIMERLYGPHFNKLLKQHRNI